MTKTFSRHVAVKCPEGESFISFLQSKMMFTNRLLLAIAHYNLKRSVTLKEADPAFSFLYDLIDKSSGSVVPDYRQTSLIKGIESVLSSEELELLKNVDTPDVLDEVFGIKILERKGLEGLLSSNSYEVTDALQHKVCKILNVMETELLDRDGLKTLIRKVINVSDLL